MFFPMPGNPNPAPSVRLEVCTSVQGRPFRSRIPKVCPWFIDQLEKWLRHLHRGRMQLRVFINPENGRFHIALVLRTL
ncbi:MAG: hypothetical protein KDD19_17520 [Phaeodactylibacter sp.]|nr:hypothetical protein [Phaeodactylibacter sp.]